MAKGTNIENVQKINIKNGSKRLPVCLCIDSSDSMNCIISGDYENTGITTWKDGKVRNICKQKDNGKLIVTRATKLKEAINKFYNDINKTKGGLSYSVETCIIKFSEKSKCILDFDEIHNQFEPNLSEFICEGATCIGKALQTAIRKLDDRTTLYNEEGISFYAPVIILLTDFEVDEKLIDENSFNIAYNTIIKRLNSKELNFVAIGIGNKDKINNEKLRKLAGENVLNITQVEDFTKVFKVLVTSVIGTQAGNDFNKALQEAAKEFGVRDVFRND